MRSLPSAVLAIALGVGAVHAGGAAHPPGNPAGTVNVGASGAAARDNAAEIPGAEYARGGFGGGAVPSLFSGNSNEDPDIIEIKRTARELESRRALMMRIADLQNDLIDFATTDPVAAHRSRIPSHICEYALAPRFCDAMTASFRKRGVVVWEE